MINLKAFADVKVIVAQMLGFVSENVEIIVRKGEMLTPHHPLHPQHFIFLAHLSTTCSGGAIVTGLRPASVCPSVRPLTISLKIFSSKTRRPILIKLGRNVPWVKLYKNC